MWTVHFIEEFLLKYNYEVWMLKTSNDSVYSSFFEKDNIHLIECPSVVTDWYDGENNKNFINTRYIHMLQLKAAIRAGKFDIINLHYVDYNDVIDVAILKNITKSRVIISYWGSDLLRMDKKKLLRLSMFAKKADYITFDNEDLNIKFHEIYKWADKIKNKTVLFGLPVLDIIEGKNMVNPMELKKKYKVPENKILIAVGYNGIPEQQHIRVLEIIKKLDTDIKEKIFLLLQMSYGGTEDYREKVMESAKKTGCKYKVIQKFLSDDEVAELRIITDLFINAQTTDAFSGSVCENLFAGTLLINASWLKYKELEKYNFQYIEFDDFDELGDKIYESLQWKFDSSINKRLILNLRSWKSCAQKWEQVYSEVLN
jgi:glycosyltransferase involved in cell wall biosynthesis